MTTVIWLLTRAQSPGRLLLVAGCGAATTIVLLTTLTVLLLPARPAEQLIEVVADPGTRGGVVLALLLLLAPVLVLAHQVLLLGSTTRARRLALLQITGATPFQVRLLGAASPAAPAGAGALAGVPGYFLLRSIVGGIAPVDQSTMINPVPTIALGLVPTSVTPAVWQIVAIVGATTVTVAAMGWHLSGAVSTSAVSLARRQAGRRPRPWGLLLVVAALGGFTGSLLVGVDSTALVVALVGAAALGLMGLAPWIAFRAGTVVARRTTSVSHLLASSRLVADPWSAGRAAAPITVIGLVTGGIGLTMAFLVVEQMVESYYLVSILLVLVLLLIALSFVAFAITAHSVETLAENRRPIAALAAAGTPNAEIERSLTAEAAIVAYPSAATGLLVGALPLLGLAASSFEDNQRFIAAGLVATLISLAVIVVGCRLAVAAATALVRPWLLRATCPNNLRTE